MGLRWDSWRTVFAVAAVVTAFSSADHARADSTDPVEGPFTRYEALEPNVAFWTDVFTKHSRRQLVFHDPYHMDLIYAVSDIPGINEDTDPADAYREVREHTKNEGKRLAAIVRRLASHEPRNAEEERIAAAIDAVPRELPSHATLAGRIRAQRGLGDQLCESYHRARPYLPKMRELLVKHGVPSDLASLPLVESGYRIGANSHAGAAGMWQFTRGTGRRFMHIDHVLDERRDPLVAAEAAAKYLRENYERLGTWPLAITAYNHGANGMSYAVRKLGTKDLDTIVAKYRSRYFGFASRNFYTEFLAARTAMKMAEERCAGEPYEAPSHDRYELDAYVPLADLAVAAGVDKAVLTALNPALNPDVGRGRLHVPKGYHLNLPSGVLASFESKYKELPTDARYASQASYYATHRVRSGQTLSHIAKLYRTSVSSLQYHNGIRNPRRLRSGQVLRVPVAGGGAVARASSAASKAPSAVRLAWGETLSHVAKRYRVSVGTLQAHNSISDPRKVRAGQLIKIPGPTQVASAAGVDRVHRVGKGQTLSHIAKLYRTTVSKLQRHNGIADPRKLRSGQHIKIPH